MNHAIIGAQGQIGRCVGEFLAIHNETSIIKVDLNLSYSTDKVDFMHVCIPCIPTFVSEIQKYIEQFQPTYIIVYGTVLPGTTEKLGPNAVHSPVEGRHPNLIGGFLTFTRFIAGPCSEEIGKFFADKGLKVKAFKDPKVTELGKMLSTTRYGVNLVFARAEANLCQQFGLHFEDVVMEYQKMYNEGYSKLGEQRFIQPLLTAPEKIGGHCVVPNAKLLTQITDDPMIKAVAEFND